MGYKNKLRKCRSSMQSFMAALFVVVIVFQSRKDVVKKITWQKTFLCEQLWVKSKSPGRQCFVSHLTFNLNLSGRHSGRRWQSCTRQHFPRASLTAGQCSVPFPPITHRRCRPKKNTFTRARMCSGVNGNKSVSGQEVDLDPLSNKSSGDKQN